MFYISTNPTLLGCFILCCCSKLCPHGCCFALELKAFAATSQEARCGTEPRAGSCTGCWHLPNVWKEKPSLRCKLFFKQEVQSEGCYCLLLWSTNAIDRQLLSSPAEPAPKRGHPRQLQQQPSLERPLNYFFQLNNR